MVSSSTITSDLNSLKSCLENYQSEIENLSSFWKGVSHDNLVAKSEDFQSEYLSTIEGEMNSFANACDSYEQYKNIKRSLEAERNNYNQAQSNNDTNAISICSANIATYESNLSNLKSQIESFLEAAASTVLTASSTSKEAVGTYTLAENSGLTQENIEVMMDAARSQLGLPYYSMHYGPREGDGQGFGCAMFVSYCYNQALFNGASGQERGLGGFYGSTYEYWGNVTNDGYDAYNKTFIEVPAEEAQPGDVVAFIKSGDEMIGNSCYDSYRNCGHVGLYAGNGLIYESSDGAHCVTETGIDIYDSDNFRFLRYVGSPENA